MAIQAPASPRADREQLVAPAISESGLATPPADASDSPAVKKVLIIAYHFPPQSGSSGHLRTLKFCRYLSENGWLPFVLTTHPRAYEQRDASQLACIPPEVNVQRVFALDTRRHLSLRGRYPRWLALPDRWFSWILGALPAGLRTIRREKIDVIYATFPIASAVLIAWLLHRLTSKPWVVDIRDPMTEDDSPTANDDRMKWRVYRWLEKKAVQSAQRLVFNAPSAVRMYRERYPELPPERTVLILNGYDEEDFQGLAVPSALAVPANLGERPLRLVHMGVLYPLERDPRPFFNAVARLKREGKIDPTRLRIELRASGHDATYRPQLSDLGIEDLVHLLPSLPYQQALSDAAAADGLLLFQAASCNRQIPAKAYEYLRLGRPILALTSAAGDTSELLAAAGGATIVDLADTEAIYSALPDFLAKLSQGSLRGADAQTARRYSRREQAAEMARTLSSICR
jgi:hypothetical protein